MSTTPQNSAYQYKLGGSLEPNNPTYVTRQADFVLDEALKQGEFCYVLNSRQMGKSSLRVRAIQRLQAEQTVCVTIQMNEIGTSVTQEQWYFGVIKNIVDSLKLHESFDLNGWWFENERLGDVQRFSQFIENVLLESISQNIVIFIDESDSILSLTFETTGFFAVIRECYNNRADKPAYQRLTFVLIGVATPSDLIQDKQHTPFNIGQAIDLTGFQLDEAQPLALGLTKKTSNPQAALKEVLDWTGGQPFLTQKICKFIQDAVPIPEGQEVERIGQLVQTKVIKTWETKDNPPHLKTIRDRIIRDEQRASQLLGLYEQILTNKEIIADGSYEQTILRLSGLVVQTEGKLTVYNRIYEAIFTQSWVDKTLATLRPYAQKLHAWFASHGQDESWLLSGQELHEAKEWAKAKNLSIQDQQFLADSQDKEIAQGLLGEMANALAIHKQIMLWTGGKPILKKELCQLIREYPILKGTEAEFIEHLVQQQVVKLWEHEPTQLKQICKHLRTIRDHIINHESASLLLKRYQNILQAEVTPDNTPEQFELQKLKLIKISEQGKLKVSNKIYQVVFNLNWVEKTLSERRHKVKKLGKYAISGVLGEGGMGAVYKGYDEQLHRPVALKTIANNASADTTILLRFKQEAEAAARLTESPHIVTVYEYGEDDNEGLAFIAMEFIKGKELAVKENTPFVPEKAIKIILQVLEALAFAHQNNIIHRDIKPANIMLTDKGEVKLTDFGIAKLTKSEHTESSPLPLTEVGTQLGTGPYMSPEQIAALNNIDKRTDVFSVGCVFYELLTGRKPFDSKQQVLYRLPENPSKYNKKISAKLDKVVQKALKKTPDARFQTADEFIEILKKQPKNPPKEPFLLKKVFSVVALLLLIGVVIYDLSNDELPPLQPPLPPPNCWETASNNLMNCATLLVQRLETKIKTDKQIYIHPLSLFVSGEQKEPVDVFDSTLRNALAKSTQLKPLSPVMKLGSITPISLRQRAKREASNDGMSLLADLLNANSELNGKVQLNQEQVTVEITLINYRAEIIATVEFPTSILAQEIITQVEAAANSVKPPIAQGNLKLEIATSHGVHNVTYQADEFLRLFIRTNQPAYVYVFVADVNKHVTWLYPERLDIQPKKVKADELFILPKDGLPYDLVVQKPFGPTTLWVVASTNPLDLPIETNDSWFQIDTLRPQVRELGLANNGDYAEAEIVAETIGPSNEELN